MSDARSSATSNAGRDVRSETLGDIGELLEAHIRLEQREVFPTI